MMAAAEGVSRTRGLSSRVKLTVGVTGHRDLVDAEKPALRQQVRAFFLRLREEFPGLEIELISPLAEGADQLVAHVARELAVPLIVPLPMSREEYEKDFATEEGLAGFRELLDGAQIIALPLVRGSTPESIESPGQARDWQYAQLGVFVSNHCQILLALWNGKPDSQVGGTAGVVNYHLTAVMPGYELDEASPNLLADNENDLAYHIVVSRRREEGGPAQGLAALNEYWLSAHFERIPAGPVPGEYGQMLQRLLAYSLDLAKYRPRIEQGPGGLLGNAPDLPRPPGAELVNKLFAQADWLAVHFQRRVHQSMMVIHALAAAMGLVFILYAEFGGPQLLLYAFLGLFVTGFLFHAIGSRREWHRKYLDYRALAEGLRVQLYWNLAGVVETQSAEFAYDNFLQKQDVDLGWIRHVMRSASLWRDRNRAPEGRWLGWVIGQWVGQSPEDTRGQLAYYTRKSLQQAESYRRTTRLGAVSLWTGILIAAVLAVASDRISMDSRHILLIFTGVFPLMAGIRDAYSHKRAERELIKQYRFMSKVFSNAQRLLAGTDDVAFQRRVLRAVGDAALEEHAEWILMHRERPLEHSGL
jgi:hypothetical protein